MRAFYGRIWPWTRGGTHRMSRGHPFAARAAAFSALLLSACAGSEPPDIGANAGLSCVDDSAHCVGQRQTALRQLVADKDRVWVKEPPTPEAYASGVRLFAFKAKKGELTCEELALGRREAEAAPGALRGGTARGLTPAQVSRGAMFASEVGRELAREQAKRCKKNKS